MSRQDVINNIMANYSQYGVDRETIEEQIRSGEAEGFSYQTIYTGLRMAMASAFGTNEYFTPAEMAEALGSTEEEIIQQIEQMKEDIIAMGLNPDDYVHEVKPEEKQRFVLPPGFLN